MIGTTETNGNGSADASTNGASADDRQPQHPPPTASGNDVGSDEMRADDVLSHVIPPSHILADGRFVRLPPPSASERAAHFERSVAAHRLISCDGEEEHGGRKRDAKRRREGDDSSAVGGGDDGTKKKKEAVDAPQVHPLAIAAARIRAKGADELSKSINLGGLVMGGEYFGVTNVVDRASAATTAKQDAAPPGDAAARAGEGEEDGGDDGGGTTASSAPSASAAAASADEAPLLLDHRLRAGHALRRRRLQNKGAARTLARHARRLSASVAAARAVDARLRSLRRRWRLAAPDHGTRTTGPVRPREVVAVDVEVYDAPAPAREGGHAAGAGPPRGVARGRIARRVPRFVTVELDDDYDASADLAALRRRVREVVQGLKDGTKEDGGAPPLADPEADMVCKTKAEPFATADRTLGKPDLDFDPDKVPLLTLLFEIEKPSTGFVERATLSSSCVSSENGESGERRLQPDERVIEALQHSLFCASLFESMRAEVLPAETSARPAPSRGRQEPVAWLSSEMEVSFLPPPANMAEEEAGRVGDVRQLCVIHCHEGEVKVQLDDELTLTVKLIEAGTTAAAAGLSLTAALATEMQPPQAMRHGANGSSDGGEGAHSSDSGSQSPAQLRTLCRALLLHSQTLYHEHCMEAKSTLAASEKEDATTTTLGFARAKKEIRVPPQHILQKCVAYGCKFVFEKKVRGALKRLSRWLREDLHVEWLPLSPFDSHSHFTVLFRDACFDVDIEGDVLHVTRAARAGQFWEVGFGSETELECYLRLEFQRLKMQHEKMSHPLQNSK